VLGASDSVRAAWATDHVGKTGFIADEQAVKNITLFSKCPASAPVRQIGRVEEGRNSGPS
jgi:hypothetical protein